MKRKVKDILKCKGQHVFTVSPDTTVFDALKEMGDRNIGGVMVVENNALVGIFTERDYARKIELKGRQSKETKISEIMTKNPLTVNPDTTINECMDIMSNKRIRHLPVCENSTLVGMISIGDVVRSIMEEQKSTIEQLEHYIMGQ